MALTICSMYKKNIKIIMKLKGSMSHLRWNRECKKIVLLIQLTMDLKLNYQRSWWFRWLWFKNCIVGISLTTKFYRKKKYRKNENNEFDKVTEMTRDIA
jgi:hypothetical protein